MYLQRSCMFFSNDIKSRIQNIYTRNNQIIIPAKKSGLKNIYKLGFSLFVLPFCLQADIISLQDILSHVDKNHPLIKASKEEVMYSDSMAVLKKSMNPMILKTSGVKASQDSGRNGYEYSVFLEKDVLFGTSNSALQSYVSSKKKASSLQQKQVSVQLSNDISYTYHDVCLQKQQLDDYADVAEAFELLHKKRKKAYDFGEISKKDILLLSIELKNIKQKQKNLQSDYQQSLELLRKKAYLINNDEPLCKDLKTIKQWDSITLENSFEMKAIESSIDASNSLFQRYSKGYSPIGLFAGFDKELNTQRISVGLSIPLNFSSNKQESKRRAALSQKNILLSTYAQLKNSRKKDAEILRQKLDQGYMNIKSNEEILRLYTQELIPLVERGYQMGETSLLEYLLAKREMWKTKQDLSEQKKSYYASLFKFFNLISNKE